MSFTRKNGCALLRKLYRLLAGSECRGCSAVDNKLSLPGRAELQNRASVFQEVEKEVVEDVPGKKPRKRTLRQMEYCYEAELEGACLLQAAVLSDCSQQGLLSLNLPQNESCICCADHVASAADMVVKLLPTVDAVSYTCSADTAHSVAAISACVRPHHACCCALACCALACYALACCALACYALACCALPAVLCLLCPCLLCFACCALPAMPLPAVLCLLCSACYVLACCALPAVLCLLSMHAVLWVAAFT